LIFVDQLKNGIEIEFDDIRTGIVQSKNSKKMEKEIIQMLI
jgi:hypothetical protein